LCFLPWGDNQGRGILKVPLGALKIKNCRDLHLMILFLIVLMEAIRE
jgi:hypothetical protein